jgi:hypothetical protein
MHDKFDTVIQSGIIGNIALPRGVHICARDHPTFFKGCTWIYSMPMITTQEKL